MAKSSICEYGKQIKKQLIDINQSQAWLIDEVKALTGLYFDGFYLHNILTGARKPQKIIAAINEILGLEQVNEQDSA